MRVRFMGFRLSLANIGSTGFLQGLHASHGDDPADIDWLVYAKTDKYYVKKFEAETNLTGYLVMDLSASMAYSHAQELTKFEYSICLAAALCYLMIHQNDPVGLITFGEKIVNSLAPKSKRAQIGNILSILAKLEPREKTDIGNSLNQLAAMLKHSSLVMIFSDLLADPDEVIASLRRLRHGGHDVILFHVLDQAEVSFPFEGLVELHDPESDETIEVNADAYRSEYLEEIESFRTLYARECRQSGIDYVPLDTSMQFDRALTEYLTNRRSRG